MLLDNFIVNKSAAETYRLFIKIYSNHHATNIICKKLLRKFQNNDCGTENREHGNREKKRIYSWVKTDKPGSPTNSFKNATNLYVNNM